MDTKVEQPQWNTNARSEVDILEVMELIPHRQPFLMLDRVEDIVVREYAITHVSRSKRRARFSLETAC